MNVEAVEASGGTDEATEQRQEVFRSHPPTEALAQKPEEEGRDDDVEAEPQNLSGERGAFLTTVFLHAPSNEIVTARFRLSLRRIQACEKMRKRGNAPGTTVPKGRQSA